ncbi:MAG: hypothetical protein RSC27_04615 [Bacilli bacterium]
MIIEVEPVYEKEETIPKVENNNLQNKGRTPLKTPNTKDTTNIKLFLSLIIVAMRVFEFVFGLERKV